MRKVAALVLSKALSPSLSAGTSPLSSRLRTTSSSSLDSLSHYNKWSAAKKTAFSHLATAKERLPLPFNFPRNNRSFGAREHAAEEPLEHLTRSPREEKTELVVSLEWRMAQLWVCVCEEKGKQIGKLGSASQIERSQRHRRRRTRVEINRIRRREPIKRTTAVIVAVLVVLPIWRVGGSTSLRCLRTANLSAH